MYPRGRKHLSGATSSLEPHPLPLSPTLYAKKLAALARTHTADLCSDPRPSLPLSDTAAQYRPHPLLAQRDGAYHLTRVTGRDGPPVALTHIPKTGGTSIEVLLRKLANGGNVSLAFPHRQEKRPDAYVGTNRRDRSSASVRVLTRAAAASCAATRCGGAGLGTLSTCAVLERLCSRSSWSASTISGGRK